MELNQRAGFLVTEFDQRSQISTVRLIKSFSSAVSGWTSTSRLSPLFSVIDEAGNSISPIDLDGRLHLVFCGPINPATIVEITKDVPFWITLGTFNVVAVTRAVKTARAFTGRLEELSVPFERWTVRSSAVREVFQSATQDTRFPAPNTLVELSKLHSIPPELHTCVSEYCSLMSSSLQRTHQALPPLVPDLMAINEFVHRILEDREKLKDRTERYSVLGILTHLNAGISRYCAQTLSGISPILQTECHFWIHSLLGTGIGNLVLHKLASFVGGKFDKLYLTARLKALDLLSGDPPDFNLAPADFWHENHLSNATIQKVSGAESLVPLLPYYSGRDGFRSSLNTVSAPLASVTACNSRQWSLMTMTHEISHIAVRGALTVLFPDPTSDDGRLILNAYLAKSDSRWLNSLRFFLLNTLVSMQQDFDRSSNSQPITQFNLKTLGNMLDRWHNEVEEIMVHVFDFLYCYGQDSHQYVRSIWLTWGVIPNIANRVHEYVVRTVCTVLVKHLRRTRAEDTARDEVLEILNKLVEEEPSPYVSAAYDLLRDDDRWSKYLRSSITARKGLVKIVRGFLYWDEAAQDIRGDSTVTSAASDRSGYQFKVKQLTLDKAQNPLRLVQEYTDTLTPNELTSAWLLYMLYFNVG
jgi:hypothetical protein